MLQLIWTYSLCCLGCVFATAKLDIAAEEVDWSRFPTLRNSDKRSQNDDISRLLQMLVEKPGDRAFLPRKKRNVLLSSGVWHCSQETVQQVISNHLKYYQLRVCQETVWEAFKIFWDRIPNQTEYQSWLSQCQAGKVTIHDVGSSFSKSEEHLQLVLKRLSQTKSETPSTSLCSPEDSSQNQNNPPAGDGFPTEATAVVTAPVSDEVVSQSVMEVTVKTSSVVMTTEPETEITNEVEKPAALPARPLIEQKLKLLLMGEPWSEHLSDPTSSERRSLTQQFTEKISTALKKLTEFKSVSVLDVRPQLDPSSGEKALLVEYIVFLQTSSGEISSETLDLINLQSNMEEGTYRDSLGPTITEDLNMEASPGETHEATESPDSDLTDEIQSVENTPALPGEEHKEVFTIGPTTGLQQEVLREHDVIKLDENTPSLTDDPNSNFSEDIEDKGLVSWSTPSTTLAVYDETVGQDSEIATDDFDPASGSGAAMDPAEETEADVEVLTDEDTPLLEDYEFSTITTVTEVIEDHVSPVEIDGMITVEDTDTPRMPAIEETKTTSVPEVDHIKPNEDERPEEDKKEIAPTETQTDEKSEVVVITENESGEVEENGEVVDSTTMAKEGIGFVLKPTQSLVEDLTEDDILLVTLPTSPVQQTSLSPEKESPFTLITTTTPVNVELTSTINSETMSTSLDYNVIFYGVEDGSGVPGIIKGDDVSSIAMPTNPGRALMVFFSLRVTNMMFSEDLFNKSSPDYKALEQRFLELLVPYLQSNLSNFENLEILNFRNGSIVVNSRMKFAKPVPRGVTTAVYLILEDFCNTAYQTMNLAIDKYSLDVESGDQADPCKYQACNEFAECTVNRWSSEAECVCNAGYFSVDGLPCQSICELQPDFCLNDGKCDIIPDQGAICRCRVGENWWYRGEHCEEYVSEPLLVGIAIASVAGFLLVASGIIFFLARTLRDQYDKDELEDPVREDSFPFLDRATKYNPMFESDLTTGYSHYYRRYPDPPIHSSGSAEASTDFSIEEIRHIYENSELTKEEIQDRIRILELYARDRQFADFMRQHQTAIENQRESSSSSTTHVQLNATS
ncbi:interphotoreceptor matrix proteoglycan 2 isoform X2 [Triplophysa rosa]|uniref:interphotoreceptor matrix proteoglycan 2 isoform X2 n=1 Tax=Triplophysa rosa TaxID=992332 RepID=UPI002546323E|nr:interphotoreceptor matrix proteoglycan 2 isoform X2 [Triplophysa rosa]